MPQQNEREYFEHRHRTCEARARSASDPGISLIHQQFADQYARKLAGLREGMPRRRN